MPALFSSADCWHDQPRLELTVTVNGRPASPAPLIRAGGSVRVVYRLTNTGDGDVDDIRVAGAGETIVCPSGSNTVSELEEHSSVVCTATLSATAGSHDGTVTATGRGRHGWLFDDDHGDQDGHDSHGDQRDHAAHDILGNHGGDDWDWPVSVSAPVGYRGVSGLIAATDAVSVTPTATGGRATFTYTVTDTGNLPVYDLVLSDPLVPAGRITCAGTSAGLQPGAVAHCTAVVDLAPGAHNSALSVTASDRTSTAGSDGGTVPPPALSTSAAARFTVVALPPPPPSPPPAPTPTPVPPPPSTPPPLGPTPTPRPTPTPTVRPTPPPPPRPTPPAPTPTHTAVPAAAALAQPPRPGIKTPLFLLVMMMPAAGAAAVLAARRK